MGGWVSEHKTVEDIVQRGETFPLQSNTKYTAALSFGEGMGNLKTPVVQDTSIQEVEKKWEEIRRANESLERKLKE